MSGGGGTGTDIQTDVQGHFFIRFWIIAGETVKLVQ